MSAEGGEARVQHIPDPGMEATTSASMNRLNGDQRLGAGDIADASTKEAGRNDFTDRVRGGEFPRSGTPNGPSTMGMSIGMGASQTNQQASAGPSARMSPAFGSSSNPIPQSQQQRLASPFAPPQLALPANTNTIPVTNHPNPLAQAQNGRSGTPLSSYSNGAMPSPTQSSYSMPGGTQPPAAPSTTPSSSTTTLPPSARPISLPQNPPPNPYPHPNSTPNPNQQNIRPPTFPANTPLSIDLQTQFYHKFRIRPPSTHGQLQMFLAQRQKLAAGMGGGMGGGGGGGVGVNGQGAGAGVGSGGAVQAQVQGQTQNPGQAGQGVGTRNGSGQMEESQGANNAESSSVRSMGSVNGSGETAGGAAGSAATEAEARETPTIARPSSTHPPGSIAGMRDPSQSPSTVSTSYPNAPRPGSSSGLPHPPASPATNNMSNGFHPSFGGAAFASSPSASTHSPAPDQGLARRLSNASNSSIASSMPLGPGQMRANLDMESIKKQMAALQQQTSRPLSGSMPGQGGAGAGLPNGSIPPKLANGSLMSETLGKAFADPSTTTWAKQSNGAPSPADARVATPQVNTVPESPSNPRLPPPPSLNSPFDDQNARQQLALMQNQQRMRDAQQAQARLMTIARRSLDAGQPGTSMPSAAGAGQSTDSPVSNGQPQNGNAPPRSNPQTYAHFLASLVRFLNEHSIPFPPGLFITEPAKPDVPGSTPTDPGYIDIFGHKLDLTRLWMTITHAGGHARVTQQNAWEKLAQYMGFPPELPREYPLPASAGTPTRTTRSSEELIREIYSAYLLSFEAFYQKSRQNALQANAARASAMGADSAAAAAAHERKASGSSQTPLASAQSVLQPASQPSAPDEAKKEPRQPIVATGQALPPSDLLKPAAAQPPPTIGTYNAFNGGMPGTPTPVSPTADGKKRKKTVKKDPVVKPQGTGRVGRPPKTSEPASSPPKPREDEFRYPVHTPAAEYVPPPITRPSSTQASTPPPPKRARYRVEYQPLRRDLGTDGGWDLDEIQRDHDQARRFVVPAVVEDLGDVDLDGLGMSLRSRIGSEVSYALTALAMLSMPGEGDDKGGLALHHCDELLLDLVDLAEDAAFGEGGWEAWDESQSALAIAEESGQPWRAVVDSRWRGTYTTLTALAQEPDRDFTAALHESAMMLDGERPEAPRALIRGETAIFNHRRTDIALVAVNLLRNFSMMSDNYEHMASCPEFLNFMMRVCDLRLVSRDTQRCSQTGEGAAHFTLSELVRLRRDALDVVWNLADKLDLSILPLDTSTRLFDLMASFILDSELGGTFGHLDEDRTTGMAQTSWLLDSALTALARVGVKDVNRRIIRKLDPDWIVDLFFAIAALLPVASADMIRIAKSPLSMDMQHRLGFSLYNLAFAAPADVRRRLRTRPGSLATLTRAIRIFSAYPDRSPSLTVASRRLTETIAVLNGQDELGGAGRGISFGVEDGYRGSKGGGSNAGSLEAGILANEEDMVVEMIFSRPMDASVFRELDRAVWI